MLNDYFPKLDTGCANAIAQNQRVTFAMKHDAVGLVVQWFSQDGKFFVQPRGKARQALHVGEMHERINQEISREACAQSLLEHDITPENVRTQPAVQIVVRTGGTAGVGG